MGRWVWGLLIDPSITHVTPLPIPVIIHQPPQPRPDFGTSIIHHIYTGSQWRRTNLPPFLEF